MRRLVPLVRQTLKIWPKQKLQRKLLDYRKCFPSKAKHLKINYLRDKQNVSERLKEKELYRIKSWRKDKMNQQHWILLGIAVIGIFGILLYFRHRKRVKGRDNSFHLTTFMGMDPCSRGRQLCKNCFRSPFEKESNPKGNFNPSPAEPGYTLPLQTV